MSEPINLMVVDLSHYDTGVDYVKLAAAGIVGVIYKSTQGTGYVDSTYGAAKKKALAAGLCWGSYHFGDSSDARKQADNYVKNTKPDPTELICLDWEPNGNSTMSLAQAQEFTELVEGALDRPQDMVLYSGNQAKESLGSRVSNFWGARRLWLAQYSTTPTVQASWKTYWLWQYSGDGQGPQPHTVSGCNGPVDCNSYNGPASQLVAEWANWGDTPEPTPTDLTVTIIAPPGVKIIVKQP
jgi:lysozyme